MRVCMVTSSYPRSSDDGAGMYVGAIARELSAKGHDVHVVVPDDPLVRDMNQGGVKVHRYGFANCRCLAAPGHGRALEADVKMKWWIPFSMPVYSAATLGAVSRLGRAINFDVIHGHWVVPGGLLAAIAATLQSKPLIITLHGSDVYVTHRNRLYARLARYGYERAFMVTAVSDDLRLRAILHGLPADKSIVIPSGVDASRFRSGVGDRFRARLGIPPNSLVIGALGRLVYKKGFGCLVDAADRVMREYPDAYCVIGGAGDLRAPLLEQVYKLGRSDRILLPGTIQWGEAPDYYAMCDIFAVPSIVDQYGNVDGLPLVLPEAMASARPIVASDVAGIPDVIQDGRNGLLVPPGDPSALAHALLSLAASAGLRRSLSQEACRDAALLYDWSIIAERFVDVYEHAAEVGTSR